MKMDHEIQNIYINPLERCRDYKCKSLFADAYRNRHPTLRLLPKPFGAYNWTPTPNISTTCVPDDIDLPDMQDEEWVEVKEFCGDELMKEEVYT